MQEANKIQTQAGPELWLRIRAPRERRLPSEAHRQDLIVQRSRRQRYRRQSERARYDVEDDVL